MFLSRLAERSGLFSILAPHRKSPKGACEKDACVCETMDDDDDVVVEAKLNRNMQDKTTSTNDGRKEQPQPLNGQESIVRKRQLDAQRKLEADAESQGVFAKKQRVKYHNKAQGRWDDAVIVGVHYDDGPDKPYYTIRYRKESENVDNNGQAEACFVDVEKQTTPERLQRVPFDPDLSWQLLK